MNSISELLNFFKITPVSYAIYEEAFTHASYAHDHRTSYNYERLEFLGDAIISKVVAEYLYRKYPQWNEGTMSKTRIIIVQSKTLAKAAQELNFFDIIKIGDSIKFASGISDAILEDAFEAFIGAVYLDQGEKKVYEILKRTIIHYYEIHSLNENRDFKSMLQELMMKYGKHAIHYKLIQNNDNDYKVEVWSNNIKYGIGSGTKIKEAQMQAAKDAYNKFVKAHRS